MSAPFNRKIIKKWNWSWSRRFTNFLCQ